MDMDAAFECRDITANLKEKFLEKKFTKKLKSLKIESDILNTH